VMRPVGGHPLAETFVLLLCIPSLALAVPALDRWGDFSEPVTHEVPILGELEVPEELREPGAIDVYVDASWHPGQQGQPIRLEVPDGSGKPVFVRLEVHQGLFGVPWIDGVEALTHRPADNR